MSDELEMREAELAHREAILITREADLDERTARYKRTEALKAADALNAVVRPLLSGYVKEMERLAVIAGQPLHSCIPGDGTIDILPPQALLQPIETCPKLPGVPYVLLVGGYMTERTKPRGPCVAHWTEDGYEEPCWDKWLGGEPYGHPLDSERVIGWYDIDLSMLAAPTPET